MSTTKRALARVTLLACLACGTAAAAQEQTPVPESAPPAQDGMGDGVAAVAAPEPPPPPEPAAAAAPAPTISEAIAGGKLLLEVRARYEDVDQKRTAVLRDRGESFTVRTRLGWETSGGTGDREGGFFRDFTVSFEMEVKRFATQFAPGSTECVPK